MVSKKKNVGNASYVLGVLSICLFILGWIPIILGIIGLCLSKNDVTRRRNISLNVCGIVLSVVWTAYVLLTM
jgi:uncharacterized membrane protein YqaE (UPF0057 family)